MLLLESGSRIHLTDYEWPKNMIPSGFSMKVRKHVRNKKIASVSQLGIDRVVDVQIGYGEFAHHLIIELYDKGNMIFTDHEYTILHLLRPRTDAQLNVTYATHGKYPLESIRKIPDYLNDLENECSIEKIAQSLLPLISSSKGPWTKDSTDSVNLRPISKTILTELAYGHAAIDHCCRQAEQNFKAQIGQQNLGLNSENLDELQKTYAYELAKSFRTLMLSITTLGSLTNDTPPLPRGFVLGKKQQPSDEDLQTLEDFHPYLFTQFEKKPYKSFDSFNKAVDYFFSRLESQKATSQISQTEKKACRKLENIKRDHEQRLLDLKNEQKIDVEKAQLLEFNRDLVDKIIIMINHAISNQLDWNDLDLMLNEAKKRGDLLASHIVQLNLSCNQALIRLKDPFSDDSDEAEEEVEEHDSDQENRDTNDKAEKSKSNYMDIMIDLDLNALNNARKYYDKKRAAVTKEEKTMNAARKVFKSAARKAQEIRKQVETINQISQIRKPFWFEKFHWFISSENYMVLAGRDCQQNEVLIKRYMKPGDIFVHADMHGASCVLIKARRLKSDEAALLGIDPSTENPESEQTIQPLPPPKTLSEAGNMAVVLSSNWASHSVVRAWWVRHDQVSKIGQNGDYLTTGAFVIRGHKNYLPVFTLDYGFGIMFKLSDESITRHAGERRVTNWDHVVQETQSHLAVKPSLDENDDAPSGFPDVSLQLDLTKKPSISDIGSNQHKKQSQVPVCKTKPQNEPPKQQQRQQQQESKSKHKHGNQTKKTESSESHLDKQATNLSTKQQNLVVKRGQKAKLKKIKQKYAEQDDDERQLRMKLLQGDAGKPSQYHVLLVPNTTDDNQTEDVKPEDDQIKDDTGEPSNQNKSDSSDTDQSDAENLSRPLCSDSDLEDNKHIPTVAIADQDMVDDEILDEDHDEKTVAGLEEDLIPLMDSFTGIPNFDDVLLYAMPVCAPYTTLMNYKFKVRLHPGTMKRGKAAKMVLHQFTSNKTASARERDLIQALKPVDMSRNFPGSVKVILLDGKSTFKK